MKRVFQLVLIFATILAVLAPIQVGLTTKGVSFQLNATHAASPIARYHDYVCIGLPPLPSLTDRCSAAEGGGLKIPNDPNRGGAIVEYLRQILKLLSTAVAAVIILMIVISGVQYITSAADPGRVKAAKDRLQNAIIALVLFLMMFAILTFLIPGGILT